MKTVASSNNSAGNNNANSINSTSSGSLNIVTKSEADAAGGMQFQTPNAAASGANCNKRPMSLDLNKSTKKPRLVAPSPLVLESPDLHSIKTLNTPDLEKILLSSNLLQTPQPGHVFPTKVGPVTSEQEAFGKGFEEALHSLHNSNKNTQVQLGSNNNNTSSSSNNNANNATNINNPNAVTASAATTTANAAASAATGGTGMSGGSFIYTNLENNFPIAIKDEPQNPPASPPVSPIDMETQEKIKLERKRQRNRVAASKCRKRKLERISKLEDKVKMLKGENGDLAAVVKTLKDHVAQLKQQVIDHIETGCSIPTIYNGQTLLQGK